MGLPLAVSFVWKLLMVVDLLGIRLELAMLGHTGVQYLLLSSTSRTRSKAATVGWTIALCGIHIKPALKGQLVSPEKKSATNVDVSKELTKAVVPAVSE